MLSRLVSNRFKCNITFLNGIARDYSVKKSSAKYKSSFTLKRYIQSTVFGITAGAIIYDGLNEFQVYGGIARFLRSLKIAALISVDYTWNLYGLENGTTKYEEVRENLLLW